MKGLPVLRLYNLWPYGIPCKPTSKSKVHHSKASIRGIHGRNNIQVIRQSRKAKSAYL